MKRTTLKTLLTVGCACAALAGARADTILNVGLASPLVVGEIIFNGVYTPPSGGQEARDLLMVDNIVTAYNQGSATAPIFISANVFPKPLPAATTTGDIITPADGMTFSGPNVTFTLPTGFRYLIAVYDGPNGGAVVWDIAALAAGTTIDFPLLCPIQRALTWLTALAGRST